MLESFELLAYNVFNNLVANLTRLAATGFVPGLLSMTARLVALDEGPDIMLDRAMVVVGRHPACDARLDSLRVSRHHCCMMHENGEVVIRDLGSTNGIRINGQRVEMGRLRAGDELSIATFAIALTMARHTIKRWPTLGELIHLPCLVICRARPTPISMTGHSHRRTLRWLPSPQMKTRWLLRCARFSPRRSLRNAESR